MMKTIITSTGNELSSKFDLRFGRARYFCLFDEDSGETKFYKNEYLNAQSGVGSKVAEKMIELGAKKIISGDFGPNAKKLLNKFKVQMVVIQDNNITVQDIIDNLNSE
jgi:predicted Fe-Mo cluster-binding NifX family protein